MKSSTRALLFAVALWLGVAAPVGADDWEHANASYKRGDYATALKFLRPLADRGDPRAQNLLGAMYLSGQGVAKDYAEALKWVRKAETKGLAAAQNTLGVMYLQGYGVARDPAESVKWFRKAAAQGDRDGQYNLGRAYKRGEGVPPDPVEAYRWYDLAAANPSSTDEARSSVARIRDELAATMTSEQLAKVSTPAVVQETAPPAAAAAPAAITPVLDAPNRSIRLNPLGVSVAIPSNMAIREFNASDNFMGITGEFGQSNTRSFDVRFSSGGTTQNCEAWFASSQSMSGRLKEPSKGAEFYDSRWYGRYYENKDGWITLCMDRPGGFLFAETTPVKGKPVEPMKEFTTNLADAFLPRSTQAIIAEAIAAAAAQRTSHIDVTWEYPGSVRTSRFNCNELGRAAACQAVEIFEIIHRQCIDNNGAVCSAIGDRAFKEKDYATARTYYLRACDLGEEDACKKADKALDANRR